jgi:hypothetical protein
MRQPPHHGVARRSLTAATAAPLIRLDDPARQDSTIRLQALPHDVEPELIQTGECGQITTIEGSVRHVEVFQMGGVRSTPSTAKSL